MDFFIERLESDTLKSDELPYVESLFEELEYVLTNCPMAKLEDILEDSVDAAIVDVFINTYGEIFQCWLSHPLTFVKGW